MSMSKFSKAELDKMPRELRDKVIAMERENAVLATAGQGKITPKVSEKGALSVYGVGRFPVTLYREQWERVLAAKDSLLEFINQHASELKTKTQALVEMAEKPATAPAGNDGK